MHFFNSLLFLFIACTINSPKIFAITEITKKTLMSKEEEFITKKQQLSEYIGYLMWRSLQEKDFQYNIDHVIEGIKNAEKGNPPNFNEENYEQFLIENENYLFDQKSQKNLTQANNFLSQIKIEEGIEEIEKDKLYFKKIAPGEKVKLDEKDTGFFHINCYTLNKAILVNTYEKNKPTIQNLEEAIPGFKYGVIGMGEGEKRILYIHPDLGYGIFRNFEPNVLLIIEVELIKISTNSSCPLTDFPQST